MDKAYKTIFINLLTSDNEADPREMRTAPDDSVELMERPLQVKKRKGKCRIIDQHDDEDDSIEVKSESDDVVEIMERPLQVKNRKRKCRIIDQHDEDDSRTESDDVIELVKRRPLQVKKKKRKYRVIDQNDEDDSREVKTESDDDIELMERPLKVKRRKRKYRIIDQHGDHRGRARISKGHKGEVGGKGKGVVKQEHEADEKKPEVKKENEKLHDRNSWVRRKRKIARGDSRKKTAFAVKMEEPDYYVEARLPRKGIHRQVRNVKRAKSSSAYDSDDWDYEEGEGSSKSVPEVIILDSDRVLKKKIGRPFVSSKLHHRSMADEEFDFDDNSLERTIDSEFKKELLEALRKPFDKAELKRCRETFKFGLYASYHPDVQRRLTKYRYKREKCLIILRGFMFWLKNVSREGVFQPWKDNRYIELELPSR
ncbi:hypothetical protein AAHA92_33435 [Salvia divinorum]